MSDAKILADADQSVSEINGELDKMIAAYRQAITQGADRTVAIGAMIIGGVLFGRKTNAVGLLSVAIARLGDAEDGAS